MLMFRLRRYFITLSVLAAAACLASLFLRPAHSQNRQPGQNPPPQDENVLRINTELVQIDVTVADKDGKLSGDEIPPFMKERVEQEVERAAQESGFIFSGVDAPDNTGDLYGLRYAEFVVPLVKAVQEQQAIIDQLKARIEELEKEVSRLKAEGKA